MEQNKPEKLILIGPFPKVTTSKDIKKRIQHLLEIRSLEIKPCAFIKTSSVIIKQDLEHSMKDLISKGTEVWIIQEKEKETKEEEEKLKEEEKLPFNILRVKKELKLLEEEPMQSLYLDRKFDDYTDLQFTILTEKGKQYKLEVHIDDKYPFEPPEFRFVGQSAPCLPDIDETGKLDLNFIGKWLPSYTLSHVLQRVMELLDIFTEDQEIKDDPPNMDFEKQCKRRRHLKETSATEENDVLSQDAYIKDHKSFCKFCNKDFHNRSKLLTHVDSSSHRENIRSHGKIKFQCKLCETHFDNEKNFIKHAILECFKLEPF